jgi:hypothetical protein
MKKGNWITGAIKRPGALKAKAKAAGAVSKSGKIKSQWLAAKANSTSHTAAADRTRRQARLAQTLGRLRRG